MQLGGRAVGLMVHADERHDAAAVALTENWSNGVRRLLASGEDGAVTEEGFRRYLDLPEIPDPDLIIRTSGEVRLSGFLLWQSAYAEFYVTPTYWPDFDRNELYQALLAYSQRDRRFGEVRT